MALGLGLGLTFTRSFANLDPDAAAYVTAVRAAGATVSGAQATAISNFIISEKAASRWDLNKRLYFPVWAVASANAICMKTLTSGTFIGGVTHAPGYIQGDGTTGHFNCDASPSVLGLTTSSLSHTFLSLTSTDVGTRAFISSYQSGTQQFDSYSISPTTLGFVAPTQVIASIPIASQVGVLSSLRLGTAQQILIRNASDTTTLLNTTVGISGTTPTINYVFLRSHFPGATFSTRMCGSIGLHDGMTVSQNQGYTLNLKTLWETVTSQTIPLDTDAAAYISAIQSAGATVSLAQSNAINNFIFAEKVAGRWTSLKRIYLPIWGIAAANAIDMVTRNSGVWSGSFLHNAGTVKGDGVTANFDLGTSLTAEGLSASTGYTFNLVTTASTLGFRGLIGRVQSANTGSVYSSNSGQLFRWFTVGTQNSVSSAGTGIISCSRQGGNASVYRRITASRSVLGTTARADAGTVPTGGNVAAFALNTNSGTGYTATEFNDCTMGAFGMGLGFTDAQDTAFTANLKTLWETTTGLVLP